MLAYHLRRASQSGARDRLEAIDQLDWPSVFVSDRGLVHPNVRDGLAGMHADLIPSAPMSLRIVVVDDNVDLVESLVSVLQHLGHEGWGATGGASGVRPIEEQRPDVALIDVSMPGVSGFDVAAQVRRRMWGHSVVLIALTGWGRDEDRDLCRDAGFDHVALKP